MKKMRYNNDINAKAFRVMGAFLDEVSCFKIFELGKMELAHFRN